MWALLEPCLLNEDNVEGIETEEVMGALLEVDETPDELERVVPIVEDVFWEFNEFVLLSGVNTSGSSSSLNFFSVDEIIENSLLSSYDENPDSRFLFRADTADTCASFLPGILLLGGIMSK